MTRPKAQISIARSPLAWPAERARTAPADRRPDKFKAAFPKVWNALLRELRRLGASMPTISIATPLRPDGLPDLRTVERTLPDPGVCLRFRRGTGDYALACDAYQTVRGNLRAILGTVAALRTMERYGTSGLLDQAISGFLLPAAGQAADGSAIPWWRVLGVPESAGLDAVEAAHARLTAENHPDVGGSAEKMVEINQARAAARAAIAIGLSRVGEGRMGI